MLQGSVRFGFFTSLPVKVTLFQASLEKRDPTIDVPNASSRAIAVKGAVAPAGIARHGAAKFKWIAFEFLPSAMPMMINPSSDAIFVTVKTF